VLLRSAEAALYRPHWTDIILNEVKRAIVEHRMADQARAQRLVDRLRDAFPEAEIHGYEPLLQLMANDPKDRHVLAAAVSAKAEVIISTNVRHFPEEALAPWGIVVQSPDQFLTSLLELAPARLLQIVREQAVLLRHPSLTVDQVLANMDAYAPRFVSLMRAEIKERNK
jgi:predicted nucleic acid-binding protein